MNDQDLQGIFGKELYHFLNTMKDFSLHLSTTFLKNKFLLEEMAALMKQCGNGLEKIQELFLLKECLKAWVEKLSQWQ